jgi:hypothetical protein
MSTGEAPAHKDTPKANVAERRLLTAHPDQVLEEAATRRQVREQGLEGVAVHGEQVDAALGTVCVACALIAAGAGRLSRTI